MRNAARISGGCTALLLTATLLLSAICTTSCASLTRRDGVKVIPADRTVTRLANGNYEVTPAWLLDRYEYERHMKAETEKLRKELDGLKNTRKP
jgi:hypothetical protein